MKLSISLGQKGPQIIHKGPFYLVVKQDVKDLEPPEGTVTGATNLMASKGLESTYVKLTSTFLNYFVEFLRITKLYIQSTINIWKKVLTKPFGQTKNGLVSGRLTCTLSKTEILNKIGI